MCCTLTMKNVWKLTAGCPRFVFLCAAHVVYVLLRARQILTNRYTTSRVRKSKVYRDEWMHTMQVAMAQSMGATVVIVAAITPILHCVGCSC